MSNPKKGEGDDRLALPPLTVKQAASYLGMPRSTFMREVLAGRVRHVRVGGPRRYLYRFELSWLQQYRASLEHGPKPPDAA